MSETSQSPDGTHSEPLGRNEWVKPALRVLSAGSAELAVGAIDDGVDKS